MESKKSNLFLGIVAVIFGVMTIFFGYKFSEQKASANQYMAEKEAINKDFDVLTEDFNQLNEELEAIKAENESLDEELQLKITELEAQKEQVSRLIRTGGSGELKKAKALIAQLQEEKKELLANIEALWEENLALQAEREQLTTDLTAEKEKNVVLTQEKEELIVENTALTEERDELIPIANYGQVIQLNELQAEAVHLKRNGNERTAKRSKAADQLKICFELSENPVATVGEQEYFVRIISPEGTAIYEEQSGSGIFTSIEDGEDMKYTAPAIVDYDKEAKNVCLYWGQSNAYAKGVYTAEVYHRGYKVGTEHFEL
ncbi:MAG: hypothetical protein R2730_15125 [Chitinophagales bacterium]